MKLLIETLLTTTAVILLTLGLKNTSSTGERFAQLENVGTFGM